MLRRFESQMASVVRGKEYDEVFPGRAGQETEGWKKTIWLQMPKIAFRKTPPLGGSEITANKHTPYFFL
jgi:hypothetical protein